MAIADYIRKQDTADGSSQFVLLDPDSAKIQATATASAAALIDAKATFGKTPEQIEHILRDALVQYASGALQKISLCDLKEDGPDTLQYAAWYIYKDYQHIFFGVARYNVRNSATWPDDVPSFVRNKLRFDTNKMLVKGNREADTLLEFFQP